MEILEPCSLSAKRGSTIVLLSHCWTSTSAEKKNFLSLKLVPKVINNYTEEIFFDTTRPLRHAFETVPAVY